MYAKKHSYFEFGVIAFEICDIDKSMQMELWIMISISKNLNIAAKCVKQNCLNENVGENANMWSFMIEKQYIIGAF